jgi:hypothetical protein
MLEVGIQLIDEPGGARRSSSAKLSGLNITYVVFEASPQRREKVSKILFCGHWRECWICISSRTNANVESFKERHHKRNRVWNGLAIEDLAVNR